MYGSDRNTNSISDLLYILFLGCVTSVPTQLKVQILIFVYIHNTVFLSPAFAWLHRK